MAHAGMRLPIESHVRQAFASEGLKPFFDGVMTFGAGHFPVSQPDRGGLVLGGEIDGHNSCAQRGRLPVIGDEAEGGMALMPAIGRARLPRSRGGVMDMSMDGSPIIDSTPAGEIHLDAGWCHGGFGATPASGFRPAHLIARDGPHPTAAACRLDRFRRGLVIDEMGRGATPSLPCGPRAGSSPPPRLGPRDAPEFVHPGDAPPIDRPDGRTAGIGAVHDWLCLRDNPAGAQRELRSREQGDRSRLVVTRNTATHEILRAEPARDVALARGR